MRLTTWARRARAGRRALLLALPVALAAAGPAGAMDPHPHWRPVLGDMGHDMPGMTEATSHQRAVARRLMRRTRRAAARFMSRERARAGGYLPAGRWGPRTRMRHFNSRAAESDGRVLDPRRPESLVFWRGPDGRPRLAAAMFRAPSDRPPPHVHNPLLRWHTHYRCVRPVPGAPRQMPSEHCPPTASPIMAPRRCSTCGSPASS